MDALKSVKELFRTSPLYRRTAIASGVLLVFMIALPLWRILPLASEKPFIPLHYNVYMGVDAFGPWYDVFLLPILGLVLLLVNVAFQALFFQQEHVLSLFFATVTVATEAILFVAMVLIVLLNL